LRTREYEENSHSTLTAQIHCNMYHTILLDARN